MSRLRMVRKKRRKVRKRLLRRSRDISINIPLAVAYVADPTRKFRCNEVRDYRLDPMSVAMKFGNLFNPLSRLILYKNRRVIEIDGSIVYIKDAV